MKEKYVIAYYERYCVKQMTNRNWENKYTFEGIVYETEPLDSYPTSSVEDFVKDNAPEGIDFKYAKIEKRFYKE